MKADFLGGCPPRTVYIRCTPNKLQTLLSTSYKRVFYHIVSRRIDFLILNMPRLGGIADFNPEKDIPSLNGKVILVTGGVFTLLSRFID